MIGNLLSTPEDALLVNRQNCYPSPLFSTLYNIFNCIDRLHCLVHLLISYGRKTFTGYRHNPETMNERPALLGEIFGRMLNRS